MAPIFGTANAGIDPKWGTRQAEHIPFGAANTANTREGKLAETPLRQAKNLFIGLITMIGKFAAIPGGMDIEETYHLIDTYIQECEKLQTEEAVKICSTI